mmetsp:Transcript_7734/g.13994  ORF Transcript_7734/g.13994 Transcript_7734/m.13994 type:complete len:210 (-) Transcript_7734:191-820(-)
MHPLQEVHVPPHLTCPLLEQHQHPHSPPVVLLPEALCAPGTPLDDFPAGRLSGSVLEGTAQGHQSCSVAAQWRPPRQLPLEAHLLEELSARPASATCSGPSCLCAQLGSLRQRLPGQPAPLEIALQVHGLAHRHWLEAAHQALTAQDVPPQEGQLREVDATLHLSRLLASVAGFACLDAQLVSLSLQPPHLLNPPVGHELVHRTCPPPQ